MACSNSNAGRKIDGGWLENANTCRKQLIDKLGEKTHDSFDENITNCTISTSTVWGSTTSYRAKIISKKVDIFEALKTTVAENAILISKEKVLFFIFQLFSVQKVHFSSFSGVSGKTKTIMENIEKEQFVSVAVEVMFPKKAES